MTQIKTVADFKKNLAVGVKLHAIFHKDFKGRGPAPDFLPIYGNEDKGIRTVSIKQTNSFALKTTKKDGTQVDNWCSYPKASECKIVDNKITIYEEDGKPVLTYSFAE